MEWLNLPGLMVVVLLLAPELLYAFKHHNGRAGNGRAGKGWIIAERIGRFGCMALMCVHTGVWEFGYAGAAGSIVWVSLTLPLLFGYCMAWVFYFRRARPASAFAQALLAALVFFVGGLLWRNVPLMLLALLYGVALFAVARQNAKPEA